MYKMILMVSSFNKGLLKAFLIFFEKVLLKLTQDTYVEGHVVEELQL